ncbi:Gfo/Idh/MocA family oxidoreductase [Photorhabdus khanii]|uniref:Thiazolinyl imide reductase n=1 Tax=Photorhabdus khanii subsp. guanajuatensis TaxID=2100166 RepID=A0A4R4JX77_9GAMM|nr:Gfo/Idh/MocA family oxidoreductase [Photorhabdus khanii]TDB59447.1 thiazolinyl imide reductase [Photorhabdus khanii subsp. guanajuatensis]
MSRPLRVVVCGTLFGQVYLSAFKTHFPGFELAGIIARGSERSQRLAAEYQVPLYEHVSQLPDDIDIACVVVRSAIVGGAGSELTKQLLSRGIHVLQEHPVYQRDVAECLKLARQNNCCYSVNTHYPNVPAVRQFTDYLQQAMQHQQPLFIEATCGVQVICGLLDILGRALGKFTPFAFGDAHHWDKQLLTQATSYPPYTTIQGVIMGIPLILNLQNQLDPGDPDNHFHIMQRICVGLPSGNLLLVNTHGPVLWNSRFHIPRQRTTSGVREPLLPQQAAHYFKPPTSVSLYDCCPSLEQITNQHWPEAIRHALRQFAIQMEQPDPRMAQYLLTMASVWKTLMSKVGNPESLHVPDPVPPQPEISEFLKQQGDVHYV